MACTLGAGWVGGSGKNGAYSTDALTNLFPRLGRLVRFSLGGEGKEGRYGRQSRNSTTERIIRAKRLLTGVVHITWLQA